MTIARVAGQAASAALGSVLSGNVVLPNNPTAGNFVVVCVEKSSVTATITVADSAGNTYTATSSSPASANGGRASIFYLPNAPANANKTITVTTNTTNDLNVWAREYSGVLTVAPVDVQATHVSATSSTNINDPSATATADGELYVTVVHAGQTISTANSPWTGIDVVRNGNYAADYIQPTAGAQAIAFTQSPAGVWTAIMAVFKAAPSAKASPIFHRPVRFINRRAT